MAEKKTAAQKAQEALDVAKRKAERTSKRLAKAQAEVQETAALLKVERAEVEYLSQHPALSTGKEPEDPEPESEPAPEVDPGFDAF